MNARTIVIVGALSGALAVSAATYYSTWGHKPSLGQDAIAVVKAPAGPPASLVEGHGSIEPRLRPLTERVARNPGDVRGWIMLARSHMVSGRFRQASAAYAEALKKQPRDAGLLTDYAEALALANGRDFAGEPERLLQQALSVDPGNVKAAGMAGRAAFDRADYPTALFHWKRILSALPADSEVAHRISAAIADAERRMQDIDRGQPGGPRQ